MTKPLRKKPSPETVPEIESSGESPLRFSLLAIFLFIPIFILGDLSNTAPRPLWETNRFLLGTVGLTLFGYALFGIRSRIADPWVKRSLILLGAFVIWYGFRAVTAPYRWEALRMFSLAFLSFLFVYASSVLPLSGGKIRVLHVCTFGIGAVLLLYAIQDHFFGASHPELQAALDASWTDEEMRKQILYAVRQNRAKALFGNPNHLSGFLNLFAASAVAGFFFLRNGKLRIASLLYLLVHSWLILLSRSRGGLLALAAMLFLGAILTIRESEDGKIVRYIRARLKVILIVSGIAILGGAVFILAWRPETLDTRLVWWKASWHLFLQHPILGIGSGMFRYVFPSIREIGAPQARYVHNVYLELLAETGFPGWILFLGFQASLVSVAVRKWKQSPSNLRGFSVMAPSAALLGFSLHLLLEFVHLRPEVLFIAAVYAGLLMNSSLERKSGETLSVPSASPKWVIRGGIAGLALFVWITLLLCPWLGEQAMDRGEFAFEHRRTEDFQGGIQACREAVRWMPLDAEARFALAWNLLFQRTITPDGKRISRHRFSSTEHPLFREGLLHLDRTIELNPVMGHYHETQAGLALSMGDISRAMEEIETAIELHPAQGRYYRFRADLLESMGEPEKAARDREQAAIRLEADRRWVPEDAE